jgi:hypothetical protein
MAITYGKFTALSSTDTTVIDKGDTIQGAISLCKAQVCCKTGATTRNRNNTLQSGSTISNAKLDAGVTNADDSLINSLVRITGGTTAIGQVRWVWDWTLSTLLASVSPNWDVAPGAVGYNNVSGLLVGLISGKFRHKAKSQTTVNEAVDLVETGIDVAAATSITSGMTIVVDFEHMYVSSVSSNTLTVIRDYATEILLAEDVDNAVTEIPINYAPYMAVNDVILIGTEQMLVTAMPDDATLTVQRAYGGTSAASHTAGDKVYNGKAHTLGTAVYVLDFVVTTANEDIDTTETVITVASGTNIVASNIITIDSEDMLVLSKSTNDLTVIRDYTGTRLYADITSGATSFDVNDASNIAVNDVLYIESEQVQVSAKTNNTLTVTRAYGGTSAVAHVAGIKCVNGKAHSNGANVYISSVAQKIRNQDNDIITIQDGTWDGTNPIHPMCPKGFVTVTGENITDSGLTNKYEIPLKGKLATTLSAAINESTTTIPLHSLTNIIEGDMLIVGTERMYVLNKLTESVTVVRGHQNSIAASHAEDDSVYLSSYAPYDSGITLTQNMTTTTIENITVSADGLAAGDVILIGNRDFGEMLYVIKAGSGTISVLRGIMNVAAENHTSGQNIYVNKNAFKIDNFFAEILPNQCIKIGNEYMYVMLTDATRFFNFTLLNGAINNSVTTITLDSASGILLNDVIRIDSEQMLVTGTGATSITVQRGYNSTSAASHSDNALVYVQWCGAYVKRAIFSTFIEEHAAALAINAVSLDGFRDIRHESNTNGWGIHEDPSASWTAMRLTCVIALGHKLQTSPTKFFSLDESMDFAFGGANSRICVFGNSLYQSELHCGYGFYKDGDDTYNFPPYRNEQGGIYLLPNSSSAAYNLGFQNPLVTDDYGEVYLNAANLIGISLSALALFGRCRLASVQMTSTTLGIFDSDIKMQDVYLNGNDSGGNFITTRPGTTFNDVVVQGFVNDLYFIGVFESTISNTKILSLFGVEPGGIIGGFSNDCMVTLIDCVYPIGAFTVTFGVISYLAAASTVDCLVVDEVGNPIEGARVEVLTSLDNTSMLWRQSGAEVVYYSITAYSPTIYLTSDALPGDTHLHVNTTTNVVVGDIIQIFYYESCRVLSIDNINNILYVDRAVQPGEPLSYPVNFQLNGAINNSQTTITLDSTVGIATGFLILIDSEKMLVNTILNGTQLSVSRAQEGTTAASHLDNAPVIQIIVLTYCDKSLTVTDGDLIPNGSVIRINGERLLVTNVVDDTISVVNGYENSLCHAYTDSVQAGRIIWIRDEYTTTDLNGEITPYPIWTTLTPFAYEIYANIDYNPIIIKVSKEGYETQRITFNLSEATKQVVRLRNSPTPGRDEQGSAIH